MRLNDPFGRMEKRHQAGYQSMRDGLRRGGINSPEAAMDLIRQTQKRALKAAGVSTLLFVLVALLQPGIAPAAFVVLLLVLVWIANSFVNGRRYIKRYIKEELENNNPRSVST
jgi:hypothetical protein